MKNGERVTLTESNTVYGYRLCDLCPYIFYHESARTATKPRFICLDCEKRVGSYTPPLFQAI